MLVKTTLSGGEQDKSGRDTKNNSGGCMGPFDSCIQGVELKK